MNIKLNTKRTKFTTTVDQFTARVTTESSTLLGIVVRQQLLECLMSF